jgi:hypothetical protein
MTLHLTSCRRADFGATEARDLAREIEDGNILLQSWSVRSTPPFSRDSGQRQLSVSERSSIVAALLAFA